MSTGSSTRVCPECGSEAGSQPFCATCGRNLSKEDRLPSKEEWERSAQSPDPAAETASADTPPTGFSLAEPPPPVETPPPTPREAAPQEIPGHLRVFGFVAVAIAILLSTAFSGIFLLAAIVAFVIGILLVVRRQTRSGVVMIVLAIAVIPLGILIQAVAFKPYRIPSEAMVPTLKIGDRIIVNRMAGPSVGDIVVFHPPAFAESRDGEGKGPDLECGVNPPRGAACPQPGPDQDPLNFVKRVVAGPGDTVSIRDGHVLLNGESQAEQEGEFTKPCAGGSGCDFPTEITIPPDHWFLLGDNRGQSKDSRFWGPVPTDWVIGTVVARTLPITSFKLF